MPNERGEFASLVAKVGYITRRRRGNAQAFLDKGRSMGARRRRGKKLFSSIEEMQALVAASNVPVTKCPPGAHLGWVPSCLR